MIVIDSSVWVAGFRGDAQIAKELSRLLDEDLAALTSPVRLELLSGSRAGEYGQLKRVLGAVPTYAPSAQTWQRVESWVAIAKKVGQQFGVMDLVVGSTAKDHDAAVWSLDDDFERMAKLRFIKLHRPRRVRI